MPSRPMTVAGRKLTLDARPDRLDLRDLPYHPRPACLPEVFPAHADISKFLPAYHRAGMILDQGQEGACTGFGLAAVINYQLWMRAGARPDGVPHVSPFMLYRLARFYDEWPGEDYDGSSCRGALKGWHKHGVCAQELWASPDGRPAPQWDSDAVSRPLGVYYRIDISSVVDMQAAIHETGAVYVSASVHKGWDIGAVAVTELNHASIPVLACRKAVGGHAFALVGYNTKGFIVQNSWGQGWGAGGFAIMTYEDWVLHGTDAWTVALGVPVAALSTTQGRSSSPRYFIQTSAGSDLGVKPMALEQADSRRWSLETAYEHTLVTGNDGRVINRLPHIPGAGDAIRLVCEELPALWLRRSPTNRKVVVYAHGGLNSETDALKRNRLLGRVLQDNGVYPVFMAWKSGPFETIGNMLEDFLARLLEGYLTPSTGLGDLVSERTDRLLEGTCRRLLVKALWSEMKENVARGQQEGNGITAMAQALAPLKGEQGAELHLVGHSAGSFVCGRLLAELGKLDTTVDSCTLYAPGCDVQFANTYFASACEAGVLARKNLVVHLLSDERELDDTVGKVYRKSLLYLVSRALEQDHKTPLVGMHNCYNPRLANRSHWHESSLGPLRAWQRFWRDQPAANLQLLEAPSVEMVKAAKWIASAHGCFDNSIGTISHTLKRITGSKRLVVPVVDLEY